MGKKFEGTFDDVMRISQPHDEVFIDGMNVK